MELLGVPQPQHIEDVNLGTPCGEHAVKPVQVRGVILEVMQSLAEVFFHLETPPGQRLLELFQAGRVFLQVQKFQVEGVVRLKKHRFWIV